MNNYVRALRLALEARWTFLASVFCALMIAILWGGNITAIYPVVDVVFRGQSGHEWVRDRIDAEVKKLTEAAPQLAALDKELAARPAAKAGDAELAQRLKQRDELRLTVKNAEASLAHYRWLQADVIGPYAPADAFSTLVIVVAALVIGTTIKALFMVFHSVLVHRLAQQATFRLRKLFYRRTLQMDLARFSNEGTSDLMNRFTSDMESLSGGMNELFGKLVREPLKMFACLFGAAFISWRLLLISMLVIPIAAYCIRWLAKSLKRANRKAMEEMSLMYNILEETFQGIKVVKAFTMERHERRRFHANSKQYFLKSMRIARYDSLTRPLTEMIGVSTICVALLAGAYLAINQQTHLLGIRMSAEPLSLSMLMLFYGLLAGVSDPARKLTEVFSRIQRGSAAADRIFQLIDREPAIVDPPRAKPLARHHRELAFEGINFRYTSTRPVLEDVTLRVPFGETVAIVGPNGCGKSTLVNLIPRFFDPVDGAVKLDGVDLRDVRMRDLRSQIGLVTQETLLFDDTVYNNIRYGSSGATREQVIAAAEAAHAHRFILNHLADGYETLVGVRGALLSGGQRQRIALARAILRDPAILILDEATSQVDLESEQLIQKVLEQFTRNRTTFIITHRMSVLSLADRIVVMDGGGIRDVGTHDQLLRRCDLYGRLYDIQFKQIA